MIDFILHFDQHLLELVSAYGNWVYGILFAIVFLETGIAVMPFLPGDSLLFATGALCAAGALNAPTAAVVLVLAAFLGDSVNYSIGRYVGPRIFVASDESSPLHRLLNRRHLDQAHAFFERYGGKAVVLGRFVPIVRTLVPFVAGAGQMTYGTFVFYNFTGRGGVGRLVPRRGTSFWQRPGGEGEFLAGDIGIVIVSLLPMMVEYVAHRRRKAASQKSA